MCVKKAPSAADKSTAPATASTSNRIETHYSEIAFALGERLGRSRLALAGAKSEQETAVIRQRIADTVKAIAALPDSFTASLPDFVERFMAIEQSGRVVAAPLTEHAAIYLESFCKTYRHASPALVLSVLAEEFADQSQLMETTPISLNEFHWNLSEHAREHGRALKGGAR